MNLFLPLDHAFLQKMDCTHTPRITFFSRQRHQKVFRACITLDDRQSLSTCSFTHDFPVQDPLAFLAKIQSMAHQKMLEECDDKLGLQQHEPAVVLHNVSS